MGFADYFDQRSHRFGSWYASEGVTRALGRGAILDRLDFAVRTARELGAQRVLDIGCGTGPLFGPLTQIGIEIDAIDPAPQMVAHARQHATELNGRINVDPLGWEDLAQRSVPKVYDLAIALGVFDYVGDWQRLLRVAAACASNVVASFPSRGARTNLRRLRYGRHGVSVVGYSLEDVRLAALDAGLCLGSAERLGRAGFVARFERADQPSRDR